jgi:TRAP-type C4-dicarboxylate transport system permease small subunit
MTALKKIDDVIARVEEILVFVMVFTIIILNVLQIFFRALEVNVPSYSTSMNQILVLWLAMVGGSLATRRAEHIKVDFVSKYLKGNLRNVIMLAINIVAMVICGFLIVYAIDFVKLEYDMMEMLTAIPVPLWVLQLVMPVSLSIILYRFFLLALEEVGNIRRAG